MEKHRCKLCSKSFSNGRALGGHMKSHLVASHSTRKRASDSLNKSLTATASSMSSSSSSAIDLDGKSPVYGLRENPRKSFRVSDPGFSFANLEPGSSSVFVVDARDVLEGSETDSEPGNPVRKRVGKSGRKTRRQRSKKMAKKTWTKTGRNANGSKTESPEPASSVSDASPEENLAMCLIMLSRDAGKCEMNLKKPSLEKEDGGEEEEKTEKRHSLELRRCLIDLNSPPPADEEACSVNSLGSMV